MENLEKLLEENNKLLETSNLEKKKINRKINILVSIIVAIGIFVIGLQFSIINVVKEIDIGSLNKTINNIETITDDFAEEGIDVTSLNTLLENLSKLSEDVNNLSDSIDRSFGKLDDIFNSDNDINFFDNLPTLNIGE